MTISPMHRRCVLPARRSDFEIRFSEVCRRIGRTKTQSNGVPENLRRNTVFHDRGDYQGRARADHHHAPGDHSPLEAGYIFADCFSSNPILLAFRRRAIRIFDSDPTTHAALRSPFAMFTSG